MKVSVDRDGCIACGLCCSICDSVFELDGEGLSSVKKQPDAGEYAAAKEAAESCPVSVIHIDE